MTTRDTQSDDRVYITAEGLENLKKELDHLRTDRRGEVAELIQRAKELGDITDSAQYDAAKDEQAFLEGRIRQLEDQVSRARIIEETGKTGGTIRVGSKVTLTDEEGLQETWAIVGRAEADTAKGRISNESPVGRAVLGHKKGDKVKVETPTGILTFQINTVA